MNRFSLFVVAIASLIFVTTTSAAPMKIVITGVGSGQVLNLPNNVVPFTNQPITFTILGDTENVVDRSFYFAMNNDSISLQIGASNYTGFAGSSYLFPQPGLPTSASFGFVQVLVDDFWDAPQANFYSTSFTTYDLRTAIGPLSPTAGQQAPYLFLDTPGGHIGIPTISQATFQVFVPEPASATMLAFGAAGLLLRCRRR